MSTELFERANIPRESSAVTATIHTYEAFKGHWFIWQLCGLKPPKNPKWRVPYILYAIVLNITVSVLIPASLIANLFLTENFSQLCESFYISISDIFCNFKFLNLFFVRSKLLAVEPVLERLDTRAVSDDELHTLRMGMRSVRKCFYMFVVLLACALMTSQLVVYLAKEPILMYPAWFPLDWKNSHRDFVIAHSYQLYGLIVQALQNVGNDTYPQAYLRILCAHIEALSLRILKLGKNKVLNSKEINRELIECIKDHQIIIELFKTIQQIISTTCLAQFICTGLAQCTIGVYMLFIGLDDVSKLLNAVLFLSYITFEILILCFFGEQLCQSSEQLNIAIYSCNWMDQDKEFKNSILMLLKRSQMPLEVMAGGLIPLKLPTFVKVMKTAYSTFAVLRQAN